MDSNGQRTNQADIYVKLKEDSTAAPSGSDDLDTSDWAAMVDEEVEKEMAQKAKGSKPGAPKVLDIQVVTASENGAVHLWKPMEVRYIWFTLSEVQVCRFKTS